MPSRIAAAGGAFAQNPYFCTGLVNAAEAVLQLRRQAGQRQLAKADIGLVHAQGGIMSSHSTIILGRERQQ